MEWQRAGLQMLQRRLDRFHETRKQMQTVASECTTAAIQHMVLSARSFLSLSLSLSQYVLAAQEEEEARRLESIAAKWSFYAEDYQQHKGSSSCSSVAVVGADGDGDAKPNKASVVNDQLTQEAQKVCVCRIRIMLVFFFYRWVGQWHCKVEAMRSKVNTIQRERDNHVPNEARVCSCVDVSAANHNHPTKQAKELVAMTQEERALQQQQAQQIQTLLSLLQRPKERRCTACHRQVGTPSLSVCVSVRRAQINTDRRNEPDGQAWLRINPMTSAWCVRARALYIVHCTPVSPQGNHEGRHRSSCPPRHRLDHLFRNDVSHRNLFCVCLGGALGQGTG